MTHENLHLKRTEILKTKGQVTLPFAEDETITPHYTVDNLYESLSSVLAKKYIGEDKNEKA